MDSVVATSLSFSATPHWTTTPLQSSTTLQLRTVSVIVDSMVVTSLSFFSRWSSMPISRSCSESSARAWYLRGRVG